jgi:peroxiredoxin
LADYRDRDFAAVGARIAALSVDEPVRAEAMRVELRLPFPVLCDPERAVVTAWGLLNTREKGGIAYPAVFVLDRDRMVRYRSLDRTAARVSAEAVLAFLRNGMHEPTDPPKRRAFWTGLGAFVTAIRSTLRYGVRSAKP